MHTIALLNQKGGVGKTAITKNLAAALAELGYRLLLVDFDPQGHLTEACSLAETEDPATLANALLMDGGELTWDQVAQLITPWRDRIDVIPTNIDAFKLERQLYRSRGAEYRFLHVIELISASEQYDICLIDCPPSLGVLTDNALVAAQDLLIPVQAEDSTMRALRLLLEQVAAVRKELRTEVDILGMVVNLYNESKGHIPTSTLAALKEMPLEILAVIADRTAIRKAWRAGVPVIESEPHSAAAGEFRALAKALVS